MYMYIYIYIMIISCSVIIIIICILLCVMLYDSILGLNMALGYGACTYIALCPRSSSLSSAPLYPHFDVGCASTHHLSHASSSPLRLLSPEQTLRRGYTGHAILTLRRLLVVVVVVVVIFVVVVVAVAVAVAAVVAIA